MEKLWNNENIGLVGRRSLLERKISPRANNPTLRFYLSGPAQVGKTALLEAAYELCTNTKAFIHGGKSHSEICKELVRGWELDVPSEKARPSVTEMEEAILGCEGYTVFVDDVQRISSAKRLDFFLALPDRHKVVGTLRKGEAKEATKRLLAKMGREIVVPALPKKDALRLAQRIVVHFSSRLEAKELANASNGLPGRIVNFARQNEIQKDEVRPISDEIDISPMLIIIAIGMMMSRYLGRVLGATDLTLLGGFGIIAMLILGSIIQRGKNA